MKMIAAGLRRRKTAALLMLFLGLGGCGPANVASLRKMPDSVYSFEVPANCATVYERIARRARQRYALTNLATYQPGVSARLSSSRQTATVSVCDAGGIGVRFVLHADLRQLDPSRTKIDVYCATAAYHQEGRLWERWANTPLDADRTDARNDVEPDRDSDHMARVGND
jgi:hypothetical protein